ncbi:28S ribosomal protein S30, mitochondrial [Hylaeus volcanicus]|uniref:28S ribosomal protein S30, mitochondrial n=1 Tax=Hylaeus volcanicus TaxID=313075 RepID=UPI0023B7871E|nr:28S ribosomal protein S30, mitochondrial [Hylaeus volcanicus]
MFIKARKCLLTYPVTVIKNPIRKYALPSVTKSSNTEVTYPPILDVSLQARFRRKKEEWHNKIKKLESVEEKLIGINMPHYYGWKSLELNETVIPYNCLDHAQYITRTHVVNEHKLPTFYDNLTTSEQLDIMAQNLKKPMEDVLSFEYCDRIRELETKDMVIRTPEKINPHDIIINNISYQINRIILSTLSSTLPHLLEAEKDFEPRVEAFWFVGGIDPPTITRKARANQEWTKEFENAPIDIPVQYNGSPILQLRHPFPLKEIVSLSDCENSELNVPEFKFDPRVLGYRFSYKHATNIPGFWPGDPAEFGLLSYHNFNHMSLRPKTFDDQFDALIVQAIFASYGWLLSQACYQGFSTVNDITYPFVSQTILTDGQWWSFCVYQLNTTLLHSENAVENPSRNMCWITKPAKLFDSVENGKVHGLNEDVLKNLIKFYINTPEERTSVNMKPFLGESIKYLADIPDPLRRAWLEKTFKHIMANRPRHKKVTEIAHWQKIYLVDHKTRPLDKKHDKWQFGYQPKKRRMDDHLPEYIPRCLRANPKKRHIGRYAKTYYPDA